MDYISGYLHYFASGSLPIHRCYLQVLLLFYGLELRNGVIHVTSIPEDVLEARTRREITSRLKILGYIKLVPGYSHRYYVLSDKGRKLVKEFSLLFRRYSSLLSL